MANSYPRRDRARGIWKINDITKNVKEIGTYPGAAGFMALCGGGNDGSNSNVIDEFNMITAGNATDFGDLVFARSGCATNSSNIRMVWSGGETSSLFANQDYVHFVTKGNAADFGDLSTAQGNTTKGSGNEVKAVTSSGSGDADLLNTFIFATLGSTATFGNLTAGRGGAPQGTTNGVRGTYSGGMAPNQSNVIDFIEITTNGNATDFGDLSVARRVASSAVSKTRSVIFSGRTNTPSSGTIADVIDSFETASQGNATNFGDMNVPRKGMAAGLSNSIKGFDAGGTASPGNTNSIEQVTIASAGNGSDFGDLSVTRSACPGNTSSHGGINIFHPRAPELYSPTGKPFEGGGGVGDIGMVAGGSSAPGGNYYTDMSFVTISSTGDAVDFGDASTVFGNSSGASNKTRFLIQLGDTSPGPLVTTVDYVEFQTKGNSADFGDLTQARRLAGSVNNDTRAVFGGGKTPTIVNTIDYVTIGTLGNGSDFGDLQNARQGTSQMINNTTRGLFAGGRDPSGSPYSDETGYITIASTSNATDFGNLTSSRQYSNAASSSTRGVVMGGENSSPAIVNTMDYFTIASTGNALDFGDLTVAVRGGFGMSNSSRGLLAGGNNPSDQNTIGFITIASTGNAQDYGDLIVGSSFGAPGSNGHGGLS